jgi:hypothetical protein
MSPDEIRARLKQLFVAMYRDNEFERGNAAGVFYRFLIEQGIHAQDVDLLVGLNLIERNKQAIEHLEGEIRRLAAENAYFRRHASKQTTREATMAGSIDPTKWYVIYDWIIETWGEPLPSDWRVRVAKILRVKPSIVRCWEDGLGEIPHDAVNMLRNSIKPKRSHHAKRPAKRPSERQLLILEGLVALSEATVRKLSFHLYGEPDTNENLADTISNMFDRKWLHRKKRTADRSHTDRSIWVYWLSSQGAQLLNENSSD